MLLVSEDGALRSRRPIPAVLDCRHAKKSTVDISRFLPVADALSGSETRNGKRHHGASALGEVLANFCQRRQHGVVIGKQSDGGTGEKDGAVVARNVNQEASTRIQASIPISGRPRAFGFAAGAVTAAVAGGSLAALYIVSVINCSHR